MKIRFYANLEKPEAAECAAALSTRARELGLKPVERGAADAVVALGGDGTILRAVHEFPETPVLGFNLGGLGYLAAVGRDDFESALAALAAGRYSVAERRMLKVEKAGAAAAVALNDVVLSREMSGRSVRIDLSADGHEVTSYLADGLIFATPTGSTAYSLSAGGSVLMPDSGSFVVTPMNPHALGVRPVVVSDQVRFVAVARARTPGNPVRIGVYADGALAMEMGEGDSVSVSRADASARFVELEGYDPYDVLARKLGWSGSSVK